MKKIILSLAMLIALATASYAQTNTSTVNQATGERNKAIMTQTGNLNTATVTQVAATTKDNTATVTQTGKSNDATVYEEGTFNEVTVTQAGVQAPASSHMATVNVSGATSTLNVITVGQSGQDMDASVQVIGSNNTIGITQSGLTNQTKLIANVGTANNENTVTITQAGTTNQTYATIAGKKNTVTVGQNGLNNKIGTYAGTGNVTLANNRSTGPASIVGGKLINGLIDKPSGIRIVGDENNVTVNQDAGTSLNEVAVAVETANKNTISISQLGTAKSNKVVVWTPAGAVSNMATVEQSGTANGNEAGIYQEGDIDISKIVQTGNLNKAMIAQFATTTNGANNATITQSGNSNLGWIEQRGTKGSTANITQESNGNIAEVNQTGGGGHTLNLTQKSVNGNRFVLVQEGTGSIVNFTQQGVGVGKANPSDVELIQTGIGSTINGQTGNATQVRFTQTGNGNTISY